jgi:TRAP-type mannitol/chloroaromatic compound transport system substrate-binding protein
MTDTRINRRAALGALAATAAAPLAAPAYAQGRLQWRMATSWPGDLALLSGGAARAAANIAALSDGRIEVEVFPAGTLMGAFDVHDAVGNGDIELYHTAEYYFQGKHRAYNFFTSVPLGLLMTEQHGWLRYGGGQVLWDELNAQHGVKSVACGGTGVQMGGWFEQPITSMEDFQSLTMRIPGLGGAVLRELGANTVVTPAGDIVEALFAGDINALEWVGPADDLHFGFPKLLATYMFPGFQEPGTVSAMGITKRVWDNLDDRDRLIFETAADMENSQLCSAYYGGNGLALSQMQREFGTRPTRVPDAVFDRLAETSMRVRGSVADDDDYGRRVVESFTAYQDALVDWTADSFANYFARRDARGGAYESLF